MDEQRWSSASRLDAGKEETEVEVEAEAEAEEAEVILPPSPPSPPSEQMLNWNNKDTRNISDFNVLRLETRSFCC